MRPAEAADSDGPRETARRALDALTTDEVEEAAGEIHRRIGVALRRLGEVHADRTGPAPTPWGTRASARWLVASLAVTHELTAIALARAAGDDTLSRTAPATGATLEGSSLVPALIYAAPTIPALLARLEQDRRLLVALGRRMEDADAGRLLPSPWGPLPARTLLRTVLIEESARCALAVEARDAVEEG